MQQNEEYLLGPQRREDIGKKTLVLDLDETLVHSSFKPIDNPDIVLPVEIEGSICNIFILVRPGVD
jgi:RNA polymerase II subunit A small phosphatase-like protein